MKYELSKKTSDVTDLHLTGMQTILDYSDKWVQVYTDISAFKGTVYAGFGAKIEYQDGSFQEISNPLERTVQTLMLKL